MLLFLLHLFFLSIKNFLHTYILHHKMVKLMHDQKPSKTTAVTPMSLVILLASQAYRNFFGTALYLIYFPSLLLSINFAFSKSLRSLAAVCLEILLSVECGVTVV